MIEHELLEEIRDTASKHKVTELQGDDVLATLARVKSNFINTLAGSWWWEFIRTENVVVQYGESDGLSIVSDLVGAITPVLLVPTDDEGASWPVFSGRIDRVVALLKELRFFEYFLTDMNYSWLVFDTHHNSLVVTGGLMGKAKTLKEILS